MYRQFFGLDEAPFGLTPDTSYYFAFGTHQEALNTLLVAMQMGEGFIKVTGEVGTGKTLLCRKLLSELSEDERFVTAYIPNPSTTSSALRCALADELGIDYYPNMGQHQVMARINEHLIQAKSEDKTTVLIIDEAQALPEDCLETIRLLTNLETEKSKLLSVVLFGQPELNANLEKPSIRQLKQRIMFSHQLEPVTIQSVYSYLHHRLHVAGYRGETLFSAALAKRIFKASGGIPRLINIIAHKSLFSAYGEGCAIVGDRHVSKAITDTESISEVSHLSNKSWRVGFAGITSVLAATMFFSVGAG